MDRCIGIDVGYGFVKVTDGREGFVFPSVVGEGSSNAPLRLGFAPPEPTDDIRLVVDGKAYYVGNLAIRQSRVAFRALSATRAEGNDLRVLVLAALSLFCHSPLNSFVVVTGLPPGRMHLSGEVYQGFKGEHKVTRQTAQGPEDLMIRVDRIEVVPQPLGTYWAQVLDQKGQLRSTSELLGGRTGLIDVGFRTTDLVAVEEGGEYVPERSCTVPIGLASAYSEIADQLNTRYNLERETYALDNSVIAGHVTVSGRQVDITDLRDAAFADLATKLLVELKSQWQLTEYDHLLLTGGGGRALSGYLLPHLVQGSVPTDPVTANSRGYLNWAYRLQSATPGQGSTRTAAESSADDESSTASAG